MNNLAVTSTGTFWTANEFNHWKEEYETRRGDLQQCGTRWAHENLEAVGRQEAGRFKQMLHRTANELVEEARETDCSVIAFEDLTDIREHTDASWGHKWAFQRLYEYVAYKATEHGIAVEKVDPENTSKRCSTCGFTHQKIATVRRLTARSAGTRTTRTTTRRRTSACGISAGTKPGPVEAHP